MTYILNRSMEKGKPNLNIIFIYNIPFRAIGKMAGGVVSQVMCESILNVVNGHFFSGVGGVIGKFLQATQDKKESQFYEINFCGGNAVWWT